MEKKPFVLSTIIPVKPGCEEEFLSIVNPVNDRMRLEPTFLNTGLDRSHEDRMLFMLHETWLDRGRLLLGAEEATVQRPLRGTSAGIAEASW